MPALPPLKKIAIIAGAGALPFQLAQSCKAQGIEPFLIGFEGQSDLAAMKAYPHLWTRLGKAGLVLKTLKTQGISDIVMIGAMKRPALVQLWPDWRTFVFYLRVGFRALGDDGFLKALRQEFESNGVRVHGVHRFMPELLAPEGVLTQVKPGQGDEVTIALGIRESQRIGMLDRGQSVIVREGKVLGLEGGNGTKGLIEAKGQPGAILVKTCKPQQDRDLDLPTIGPATARQCAEAGIKGIVVEAGATLITEREKLVEAADIAGIFVYAIHVRDYLKP